MLSNVACSSPGCTNPVVGQCGGYKKNCGSFYCVVHSKDKLCSECSERKAQDDLIEEYYKLAQYADKHAAQEKYKWGQPVAILCISMICLPMAYMFFYVMPNEIQLSGFLRIVIGLTILTGLAAGIVVPIYAAIFETRVRNKIVADLDATKPNFREFYNIYKSEKRKEMLRMVGGIAMGVVASVAADAQRNYERQRKEEMIRKAVDDELNRHGL